MCFKRELLVSGCLMLVVFSALATDLPKSTVAVVNGTPISAWVLEATVLEALEKGVESSPQLRELVLSELIKVELLAQRGKALGFSTGPDLNARVSFAEAAIVARYLERFWLRRNKPKENELRAAYEDRLKVHRARKNPVEVFLYQITMSDVTQTESLVVAHGRGESFETLLTRALTGKYLVSANLSGWRALDALPSKLAAAISGLDRGEINTTPIRTSDGWLLVKVLDKRNSVMPSYESMLETLKIAVVRTKWTTYLQNLADKADVTRVATP
jgi:peptidyl-prolyl cis-trans isomerase C